MTGQPPDDHLRVGTVERDATARVLNKAFEEGRLTPDELDERLEACFSAKTRGDLTALTADLPVDPPPPPKPNTDVATRDVPEAPIRSKEQMLRDIWTPWAGVSMIVTVIWLITAIGGGGAYFWPIWVIGPWGAVNALATLGILTRTNDDDDER